MLLQKFKKNKENKSREIPIQNEILVYKNRCRKPTNKNNARLESPSPSNI